MKKGEQKEAEATALNVKLTREELEQIQDIQSNMQKVTFELGNIQIQSVVLEKRKATVLEKLEEVTIQDNSFTKELFEKYGQGSINLEKGEFIKASSEE